jgi:SRSO17 transposase
MTALIETAPKMDAAIEAMEHLVEEWRADHALDSPLFQRREPRDAASIDCRGVLAALPRTSIEPLGLAVEGVVPPVVRALPSCIRDGRWAEERRLHQHGNEVERDLGADDGVLRVDGRDVPTQGVHAAGVTRPYGGELGTRANGQAGVGVGDGSTPGDTVLERRLDVPAAWVTDDAAAARRTPCGMPPESTCKTTPALAQATCAAVVTSQCRRCRGVVVDEACGNDTGGLDGVVGLGLGSVADVPPTTRVWRERPATHVPPWRGRGRRPQRARVVAGAPAVRPGLEIAAALPVEAWSRQTSTAGRPGPMVAEVAARRVMAVRDALPGPDVWLGLRRHLETGAWKTDLCHAPRNTAWHTLVRMRGRRWPIDTGVDDSQPRLGMGDSDVRSWPGWPHQMTLVILAHFLVVRSHSAPLCVERGYCSSRWPQTVAQSLALPTMVVLRYAS